MSKYAESDKRLNTINWKEIVYYDEHSPTCLSWVSEFRKGRNGSLVKRISTQAGSLNKDGLLSVGYNKNVYSVPKIIWILHNGVIPEGKTVWFLDGDKTNARISNLYLHNHSEKLSSKYDTNLSKYLAYDPTSPSGLRWIAKTSKNSHINVGDKAGSLDQSNGYWTIHAFEEHYKVHRLIWFFVHGEIPEGFEIDHIDGNRQNNRIDNLRCVKREINQRNRSKNKNNSTGYNMISYYEGFNKRGTEIRKYTVTVSIQSWTRKSKSFSCIKYGDSVALEMAIEYRDRLIKEINARGAGYTDRHGT